MFLKAENMQHTGSFKYRGAFNAIASLSPEQAAKGVIAYSSGNHAQGVACAAAKAGVTAQIIMPADAPVNKIARTQGYGATVILYDRINESREDVAAAHQRETGATLIPPLIIPGQFQGKAQQNGSP